MLTRNFTIINRLGLHARAAALLVKTASRFSSEITIKKEDMEVNGKSIMGILLLAAPKGSDILLMTDGSDEELAMQQLAELIEDGFGEE
ncbi:HPr family phosphocarrier protein [Pelovirga terrestris]|uniref:HPr family phosphocarrier protein n=1 Tax=Pelovirga terrestris TaxID=2771352 RepID=A0A8J6QMV8_9BACT|nr:HPr family phosphocarrier protein [Pelovirga terrestris]MBD1401629.1 HPr family phosphocarrier protein [Pelovirga terrestris]